MATYQIYFDTQAGEQGYDVDIHEDEVLDEVLQDMLRNLSEQGYVLKGVQEGGGNIAVTWEGRELNTSETLPAQGVRPNDVIRVAVKQKYLLQVRNDSQTYDVVRREEIGEGSDVIVGNTILRFHIKKQQKRLPRGSARGQAQKGGGFQRTVYFMGLVGGIAGLICWFVLSWVPSVATVRGHAVDVMNLTLLGAIIGGLTVGFSDHWFGDRVIPRWVLMGVLCGGVGGALGGLISTPLRSALTDQLRWLASPLLWTVGGALIGFGISSRWYSVNKTRTLHGLIGGLFGGLAGGIVFWSLPHLGIKADISQALGFVLTGMGITFGIGLAPVLLRQGVLEFVSSGDRAVLGRYEESGKQWEIHDGGKYLIGSLSASQTRTVLGPEVQIFIPDQMVAPRHAVLTARKEHYTIEPHPELTGSGAPYSVTGGPPRTR